MKWMRPSGNTIETNDSKETIAYAESLGWKEIKKAPAKKAVKKAVKKK